MGRRERDKPEPSPAPLKDKSLDILADEKLYSRSLKIRTGILDCLYQLATEKTFLWDSLESLGGYCGNYIGRAGWEKHAASSVSCVRWLKQYLNYNGPFKIRPAGSGTFTIAFRARADRAYVAREIKNVKMNKARNRAQANLERSQPPAPLPAPADLPAPPLTRQEVM